MPTVLLITTPFIALVDAQAKVFGVPLLPRVVLPHPIGGTSMDTIAPKIDAVLDEILAKLTTQIAATAAHSAVIPRAAQVDIKVTDEWGDLQSEFVRRGWGDGFPIVPPTKVRVDQMFRFTDLSPEYLVASLAPRMGAATVEAIAINAVMAGCRPHHMPLLIASVQAMSERSFNLYGMQATTHCVSPLLIVNGPLAKTLNVNAASSMFGPGPWDNGVIGRAIRLLLLNIGGAIPGAIDKSTMGHPAKYTFVMAENEAASPWLPLRAERGYGDEVSTVTVVGAEGPHNINDHESTTAEGLIRMIAGSMAQPGQNNVYYAAEPLLILSPEHAATIAAGGYSKDDLKLKLFEDARIPLSQFSDENIERRMFRKFPQLYKDKPSNVGVRIAQRPQDIMVVVAGGPGKHSMYVPTFGGTICVTVPILHADGRPYAGRDFEE